MSKNNNQVTTTVKQLKEIPGMLSCVLEHDVVKTKARIKWEGPKLNDIWPSVLAFMKWTYDEYKSESQLRLYLNTESKKWGAFAHPQEARTGMTTKLIGDGVKETESESRARAALMGDDNPGNWMYFGTVHHHCNMGAFQSGTDASDEEGGFNNAAHGDGGLHITIGKMGEKKYDFHARLYLSGHKFEPDMSWFWDVETLLASVPPGLRRFLSSNTENDLARDQMCLPPPPGTEFPAQWKENVIEIKRSVITPHWQDNNNGYQGGLGYSSQSRNTYRKAWDLPRDIKIAVTEFEEIWLNAKIEGAPEVFLDHLCSSPVMIELTKLLHRNEVSLEGLMKAFDERAAQDALAAQTDQQIADYNGGLGMGGYAGLPE